MTMTISLLGARGGQGTTTTAAVLALLAARQHRRVEVIADDIATISALLGLTVASDAQVVDVVTGLQLRTEPSGTAGLVITDTGALHTALEAVGELVRVVVLRGPCYLSLRATTGHAGGIDGIIVVREAGRSLTPGDVAQITGVTVVAETQATPRTARAVDAGVLPATVARLAEFATLERWLETLPLAAANHPATPSTPRRSVRPSPVRFDRSKMCTDLPLPLSGSG